MKNSLLVSVAMLGVLCFAGLGHAQNDWQYPDPYFGILEIEKSHSPAVDRRYREEIGPRRASQRDRGSSYRPGRWLRPRSQPPMRNRAGATPSGR